MAQVISGKSAATKFVEKISAQSKRTPSINRLKDHKAVLSLAEKMGYKITLPQLQSAMKGLVNKTLATKGIPKWVLNRMSVEVHD